MNGCCESKLKIVAVLAGIAAPSDCMREENCELRNVSSQVKSGASDVS